MTLDTASLAQSVQILTDRAEIADMISTLFHRVDSKDYAGVVELFAEDGEVVIPFATFSVAELVEVSERIFTPFQATHHMIGNVAIIIDGDTAQSRQYLRATHVPDLSEPAVHADVGGWYEWRYRRTADGWRITRYELNFVFTDGMEFKPGV